MKDTEFLPPIWQDSDCEGEITENKKTTLCARIKGGPLAPKLQGIVLFEEASNGVWVTVKVSGLPKYQPAQGDRQPVGPHGFHLHDHAKCTAASAEPFMSAGGHYNPTNQPHGNHAGDFPVLFSNHGIAMMSFFTDKFQITDIVGKSVIIHENPDDYRSQPAGNSGRRLACGIIKLYRQDAAESE